ncbi:hypothetical protein FACS18945_2530 [Bacteroidia bacterium]|nr:hypothetical protein FACS18945_2530 [Bacteroidia bacterium]
MNIYEKIGDFILNIIQLVVGGIIFAAIMADNNISNTTLYISAISVVVIFFALAILAFKYAEKNNKNKKEDKL